MRLMFPQEITRLLSVTFCYFLLAHTLTNLVGIFCIVPPTKKFDVNFGVEAIENVELTWIIREETSLTTPTSSWAAAPRSKSSVRE